MILNIDIGEGYGPWERGRDRDLIPFATSVSLSIGGDSADALHLREPLLLARQYGVTLGIKIGTGDSHPFAQRPVIGSPQQLYHALLYQIGAGSLLVTLYKQKVTHIQLEEQLFDEIMGSPQHLLATLHALRDGGERVGFSGAFPLLLPLEKEPQLADYFPLTRIAEEISIPLIPLLDLRRESHFLNNGMTRATRLKVEEGYFKGFQLRNECDSVSLQLIKQLRRYYHLKSS